LTASELTLMLLAMGTVSISTVGASPIFTSGHVAER
jgi:hypothetical protein